MPGPPVKGGPGIRAECPWRESNPRPSDYKAEDSEVPEDVVVEFPRWAVEELEEAEAA